MAFTYCPSCGYKNLHGVTPPKFCGGCGATLGFDGKSVAKTASGKSKSLSRFRRQRSAPVDNDDADKDGLDINSVPHISSLKYKVEESEGTRGKVDLKSLAGEISEDQLAAVQTSERETPKKRGRPKGSKNLNNGKKRTRKK